MLWSNLLKQKFMQDTRKIVMCYYRIKMKDYLTRPINCIGQTG